MNRFFFLFILATLFLAQGVHAQTGIIRGKVTDAATNEPIPFAIVSLEGTSIGMACNIEGVYELKNLNPGLYNVQAKVIGFKSQTVYEIQVTNVKAAEANFALEADVNKSDTVVIQASPFNKTAESPVSLRTIGVAEIERNPGGNRDISKAIQSLPGVASSNAFRNDIIIRGGAPNENRFFLDGVEVPNINHFATQGASGGPVGMINVNFIREVDFYSGEFPAMRGNAMSSVFDFKMKDGNPDKLITTATIGASDFGLTFDGPIGKRTNFIFSARRSYLQFLFKALELPFLPIYNDFQLKTKTKIGEKGELCFIGLGAIDNFELNLEANETEDQKYLLGNLPVYQQWNYTNGLTYRHNRENGYLFFVLSRNMLNNTITKYINNDESSIDNLIQNYKSQESENKFRFEQVIYKNAWKFSYGTGIERVRFTSDTYQKIALPFGVFTLDFDSKLNFQKYSLFAQVSRKLMEERLTLSAGLRTDFSDYSKEMSNPIDQLSPRVSLAFAITEKIAININAGRYYQLPAYTVLGYRDTANQLVNKNNGVKYIRCDHLVAGIEIAPWNNAKITLEGFYKIYQNYPFLLTDSISLANLGVDFGVIGNAPVSSTSDGRSFGAEFLLQQKLFKGFYGIAALTLVRSEFKTKTGVYAPSAWDNRFIVALTAGKKFKKNWELGVRWRVQGGTPFTPFNVALSSLQTNWDITGRGIPDYDRLNESRLSTFHQMDIRVDKKWFLKKFSVNLYMDIQNLYRAQQQSAPILTVERDSNGNPVTDPNNPNAYKTYFINQVSGNVLPTIGLIVEF
ncbi:MAG: TonB-dependent receptor [Bacteroidia bacterium]